MSFSRKEFSKNFLTFFRFFFYRNDSHLWSNEEITINAKDLNLTIVTFWNLLAVKCLLEKYSNLSSIGSKNFFLSQSSNVRLGNLEVGQLISLKFLIWITRIIWFSSKYFGLAQSGQIKSIGSRKSDAAF